MLNRKILNRIFFIVLALVVIGYLFISYSLSNRILFPVSSLDATKSHVSQAWGVSLEEVLANYPKPEKFIINTFDGIPLSGKHFIHPDSTECAVVFAHGWQSTWAEMMKYAPMFWDCGCDLVLFDHRAHGESAGKFATGGIKEGKDLLAVTDWVRTKGFSSDQIGWMGSSWGAVAAMQAGATTEDVAFIVADAPFQDWHSAIFERALREHGSGVNLLSSTVMQLVNWRAGIDHKEASAIKSASQITEPVLLIHSRFDPDTHPDQSVRISKKLNNSSEFHMLKWGGKHTEDVFLHREKFMALVHDFLKSKVTGFGDCGKRDADLTD